MNQAHNNFPPGWDEESIQELIEYHESLQDAEFPVEDEAASAYETQTMMTVPTELVPVVRELIATYEASQPA